MGGVFVGAVGCALPPNELGNLEAQEIGARSDIPLEHRAFDAELVEACGEGRLARDRFTRTPYLQQVRSDGAQLLWASATDGPQQVEITLPDGDVVERVTAELDPSGAALEGAQHRAVLDGLEPDTVYCYTVDSDGTDGRIGFRTAPAAGQGTHLSFLAFGDSGREGVDQEAVFDQMRSLPADLVLVAGDLAYGKGTLAELEATFFQPYATMLRSLPVQPVLGNHDYGTDGGGPYRAVFSLPENGGAAAREGWWSFDRGPVHVVGLDSGGDLQVQAEWLEQDLGDNGLPWVVAMLHAPPYSSGAHGSNMGLRAAFGPIFDAHGVQLVISGHEHDYERTKPIHGTTYIVTGGGGVGTRPVGTSSFTAFSTAVAHFLFVSVDGDDMRVYAVDATGQEFDFTHIVHDQA